MSLDHERSLKEFQKNTTSPADRGCTCRWTTNVPNCCWWPEPRLLHLCKRTNKKRNFASVCVCVCIGVVIGVCMCVSIGVPNCRWVMNLGKTFAYLSLSSVQWCCQEVYVCMHGRKHRYMCVSQYACISVCMHVSTDDTRPSSTSPHISPHKQASECLHAPLCVL